MKNKNIKWGQLKLKGLDENNLNVFNTKHLVAIENGINSFKNKSHNEIKEINEKKSKSHIGLKQSDDVKKKKSEALKGKPKTKEHIKNLSLSKIGKKQSVELIEKKKIMFLGEGNPMFGKNHSKKSRKKISENHGSKIIKKCPHCGKECPSNNYSRYHDDNCKYKK